MLDSLELAQKLLELDAYVHRVLKRGEQSGDDRLVLSAVREGRMDIESLSRLGTLGAIEDRLTQLEQARDVHADDDPLLDGE